MASLHCVYKSFVSHPAIWRSNFGIQMVIQKTKFFVYYTNYFNLMMTFDKIEIASPLRILCSCSFFSPLTLMKTFLFLSKNSFSFFLLSFCLILFLDCSIFRSCYWQSHHGLPCPDNHYLHAHTLSQSLTPIKCWVDNAEPYLQMRLNRLQQLQLLQLELFFPVQFIIFSYDFNNSGLLNFSHSVRIARVLTSTLGKISLSYSESSGRSGW